MELNKDWPMSDFNETIELQEFDMKLVEIDEKIRDKKKLIDNTEAQMAKENSLELLTSSLSTLKQLQVEKQQQMDSSFGQQDKSSMLQPIIKETTPGVWV
jgi:hypothetical protein